MRHYSLDELDRYRNNDYNFIRKFLITRHIGVCDECSGRLSNLSENDMLLADLRESLSNEPKLPDGKLYDKLESQLKSGGEKVN